MDRVVAATVLEEMPSLVYRLELSNKAQVLAHGTGAARSSGSGAARNWVRLLPGDRVEVELAEHDPTRGRIIRKMA